MVLTVRGSALLTMHESTADAAVMLDCKQMVGEAHEVRGGLKKWWRSAR